MSKNNNNDKPLVNKGQDVEKIREDVYKGGHVSTNPPPKPVKPDSKPKK